ncbi:MAG: hypothetical protein IJA75_10020 [Oscillospiraceae bacterium]|nr:hypothetical protein [Oscillospiraceae bacterium]
MKKKRLITFILSLALILGACLLAARHNHIIGHRTFPWHLAGKWYCEEIDMTLEYIVHNEGYLIDSPNSILVVSDHQYEVFVGFYGTNLVSFQIKEGEDTVQERGLRGVWNYRFGKLVIRILEDSIWDEQYSELVFVPCKG